LLKFRLTDAIVVFDGKRPLTTEVPDYQCMVKGDVLLPSVAAASVVAKVIRDELMVCLDSLLPGYEFSAHKGYGTKTHLEAIRCFWHYSPAQTFFSEESA